jgi:Ca-activated chloride channel family protein
VIGDFHFLRPEWLLVLLPTAALLWVVSRGEDARTRWRDVIAPHLLDHLVVGRREGWRVRPVHLTVGLLALGAVAAAGPTWERERPPFVEDNAPLAIAIDLSRTMDAIDIAPTRLERAKLKVRDLVAARPGARTAIFAYAGSAHTVLPLTDDPGLLQTYVDALSTGLMPVPGKDTAKALTAVEAALAHEDVPGTILFLTDGVEPRALEAFRRHQGRNEIMVLGIGTAEGGPVKTGEGSFLTDPSGRRVVARLDGDGLRRLKSEAGVPVATITLDDGDVRWIERRVQTHLRQRQADAQTRWRDVGWYLTIPLALLGALWFRRGWTIRWASLVVAATLLTAPGSGEAADWRWLDPWLTADQQGRLAYERGDYRVAADRFVDPMWKGVALYRAGRYAEAIDAFARVDTAESDYNGGNALARLGRFEAAAASYRQALGRRPDWPEAKANLALVQSLIARAKKKDDEGEESPDMKPDEIKFDDKGGKGKKGRVDIGKQTAEMWMRNIQTTPAELLRRKFAIQVRQEPGR